MAKIPHPFNTIGETLGDIKNWLYSAANGTVFILSPEDKDPILQIGGPDDEKISTASKETQGTVDRTTYREGLRTNPLINYPSSFIVPIPPWISSVFSGPLSVTNNPELLIAIIAIAASASGGDEKNYSYYRETLPTMVIDNQELENALFNEENEE